jgi:hypothetical protein
VPLGGSVSTDEGDGATFGDPVETTVTSPTGGTVTISEGPVSQDEPAGFEFFGQQVDITAPPATAADPLVIVFLIDASVVPAGEDHNSIQVFRNGVLVGECTGAPDAVPDPCVSERATVAGGDIQLTVLTSMASAWNFGVSEEATPTATATATATPTPTPGDEEFCADVTGDGKVKLVDVLLILLHTRNDNPRFDVNDDGDVDLEDVLIALFQLGDRCGERDSGNGNGNGNGGNGNNGNHNGHKDDDDHPGRGRGHWWHR